jgi:hypothetical protein
MVSEFEGLSINETWKLPVIQFLNDMSYLKMKRRVDDDNERMAMMKAKQQTNGR